MAKPNVHTASRDELLGVGLRTPIVNEIIQRRQRNGGIHLVALAEIPGVGPATIERLRQALDFEPPAKVAARTKAKPKRQPRPSGKPAEPPMTQGADVADVALEAGTEQAVELVTAVTSGDVEVARSAPPIVHDVIEANGLTGASEPGGIAAEPHAGAAGQPQDIPLDVGTPSSFARMLAEALREQAEANIEAATALAQAKTPSDVLQLQGDYVQQTLERMANLSRRSLELAAQTRPEGSAG